MDRGTYLQLDRIEAKLAHVEEGLKFSIQMDAIDSILDWYEQEVVNPDGQLNHLVTDQKLKKFMQDLESDESEEHKEEPVPKRPTRGTEADEYRQ